MCKFICSYHDSVEEVNNAQDIYLQANSLIEQLNTDHMIYSKLKFYKDNTHCWLNLEKELQHVLENFIMDFEKSGASQSKNDQKVFMKLSSEICKIGDQFIIASEKPVMVLRKNCPTPLLNFANENDPFALSKSHINSQYDDVRESSWKTFYKFDNSREVVLTSLLNNRHNLAITTGFSSFRDRELKGSLAGSSLNVLDFLGELNYQIKPIVKNEIEYFRKFKRTQEPITYGM